MNQKKERKVIRVEENEYYTVKEVGAISGVTENQLVYILRRDLNRESLGQKRLLPIPKRLEKFNYWPSTKLDEIIEGIAQHNRTKIKNAKKAKDKNVENSDIVLEDI